MIQTEQDWPLQDSSSHITNTGRMIEEMEIKMRNLLQEVRSSLTDRTTAADGIAHRCTLGRRVILCMISGVWTI